MESSADARANVALGWLGRDFLLVFRDVQGCLFIAVVLFTLPDVHFVINQTWGFARPPLIGPRFV